MKPILQLDKMTRQEKLQAMEELWQDLSRNEEDFESPAWHETVLNERKKKIASGEAAFLTFEELKERFRR